MKTDIQIAQEAVLEPVTLVAERAGIPQEELELYGKYKAKVSDGYIRRLQDRPEGKLDRKSTRLTSSHVASSRMPSSA